MSNLTPEDVNLRLTETRNELQLEDTRLWQGLEDERVSRIAGDAANNNLIENNKNGFLVTDADVAMMVKTIENILIDTVITQSVVNEARMLVEAMDAEIIQQKWLKLLA